MQYHHNPQRFRLVPGMAALSLLLGACHSASSGIAPYFPANGTSSQQAVDRGSTPEAGRRGELRSSCGHHIRIVLAGIVNCRFHEIGDRDATFTLKNATRGLILISPMTGNRQTLFTITGLVIGSGHFTVRAGRGKRHHLRVSIRVTL